MSPLLALTLVLAAQDGRPVHPKSNVKPIVGGAPVTTKEARASFIRVQTLLQKVNGRSLGKPSIPEAARAVTRDEVVAEMTRLYKAAEPDFKFTPAAAPSRPNAVKISAAQRANLLRLIVRGCVAPVGPLAVGPQNTLTVDQFGDALGFFAARVTQMTHTPSSRWTPALMDPNG